MEKHSTGFRGIGSRFREVFIQILALLLHTSNMTLDKLLNYPSFSVSVKWSDNICLMGLL